MNATMGFAIVVATIGVGGCCFSPAGEPVQVHDGGSPDAGPPADAGPPTYCTIGGSTYADGAPNPLNACQSCQPAVSTATWSDLPAGATCADGGLCQGGTCRQLPARCVIGGVTYSRGAANPSDPSQCCSPASNTSGWASRLQDGGTYQLAPWLTGLAVADFNQDGRSDIAGVSLGGGTGNPEMVVMLRQSDGTFAAPVVYPILGDAWGIAAGDLNGDRFPDLVVVAGVDPGFTVFMNLADGTGGLSAVNKTYSAKVGGQSFPLVDFNGDGILDLATGGDQAYFLKGLGDGGFADPVGYQTPSGPNSSVWSTAAGRFGPGKALGFATANGFDQSMSVFLGNGNGTFAPQELLLEASFARSVAAGDFDGDGFDDLALEGDNGPLVVALSKGDGTFGPPMIYPSRGGFVTMADLDGDGKAEVLTADWYGSDTLTVRWHAADGGINATTYPASHVPSSVAAADLNGDGTLDVAVGNVSGGVNLYINACP
jgi:hypothetical protein